MITLCSSHNWATAAVLDPNRFFSNNSKIHEFVNSCADQLALLHYASETTVNAFPALSSATHGLDG